MKITVNNVYRKYKQIFKRLNRRPLKCILIISYLINKIKTKEYKI